MLWKTCSSDVCIYINWKKNNALHVMFCIKYWNSCFNLFFCGYIIEKHYTRRTHRRRRIRPITSQPVRRRLNQRHWTQPDTRELCIAIVSQPNHLSSGSPPPPYYEEHRGLPTESSRTAPPSYQSLFPNRPLGWNEWAVNRRK